MSAVSVAAWLTVAPALAWEATEEVKPYKVTGSTGIELYTSIGEKGPKSGDRRTIAHTTFDLKWRRNYEPDGTSCTLTSAIPFLTITYTWPKAAGDLPEPARKNWQTFIKGIETHERYHGQIIREMVDQILETTVGMTVPDDPKCRKIRKEIETPLKAASQRHLQRSREFDEVEMSSGGNVHQLILNLVNGG